jgi:hypothetical protein
LLRSVDLNVKPSQMSIQLAKPNRTIVGKIKHYNKTPILKLSLGRLNEISFTIPYKIEKNHELVDNPIVSLIRNRFLLKVKWNHISEWFIINEISDSVDDSSEGLVVHAFSLGNELKDKLIEQLQKDSLTPQQVLTEALLFTNWSVGTIDAKISNKYRSFDITETTVLDFLFTIADTYGVLLVFDSENKKVNLVHPDNYKINRGFKLAYGQYLKSLTRDSNSDDMTTQLIVTGKDGLSINRINPTGASSIESFSYFMYPFERDTNRNVIQSSHFMSDELCHAILDYEALVESKKGEFSSLLDQLNTKQTLKTTKDNELFNLKTDLQIILDSIEVRKSASQDYSDLIVSRDAKQTEVNNKQNEINVIQTDIDGLYVSMDSIKSQLSIPNNFTPELIQERNDYIITKKWSDENYIDDQELYDDAKVKFDDVRKPKINITVGSVNFFQMIEEQRNWDKLFLGDVVVVRHPMIDASYEIFVTDMEVSDEGLNLTIADFQEIRKDDALLEKINQSYSSSVALEMSKYKWNQTTTDLGEINDIINGVWDATKRRITAGVNESVEISNRGVIIRNPDYPNEVIILQAGVMAISGDNGDSWKTVSNAHGVFAETLMGKIIAGVNLYIENEDGKFTFDKNGVSIDGASFTVRDVNGNNMLEVWNNSIGENTSYNGVIISQDSGIVVNRNDNKIKTFLNATEGIKIQTFKNNSWVDAFYADLNGVLHANGLVIKSADGAEALIDGTNKTIDFSKFTSILGKVNANNIQIGADTTFANGYDPSALQKDGEFIVSTKQLILNSTFETGADGSGNWSTWNSSAWTNTKLGGTSKTFEGVNTAKVTVTGLTSNEWRQIQSNKIKTSQGRQFTLSVYSFSDNIASFDQGFSAEFEWWDSTGTRIGTNSFSLVPSQNSVWERKVGKATAPANAVEMNVRFHPNRNGIGWIAKPMLTEGTLVIPHAEVSDATNMAREDLRLSAPLPTSLTLNQDGIRASTSDPTKYAQLDYRGLYVKGGAIQIENGLSDSQIGSASTWHGKETPSGAQSKANAAGQAVRDDLRFTAPLPTSLLLNGNGITASTSDATKYARLDYRGLFVKKGAVQIERPDGALFIEDGLVKMDFAIQPTFPADLINTSQGTRHYVSDRTVAQNDGYIGLFTFRKQARYLEFEVALSSSTLSYAAIFKIIESGSSTSLGQLQSTEALGNETVKKLRIDMGVPDFSEYAVRALLLHNYAGATAYCRIIRIRQTDF